MLEGQDKDLQYSNSKREFDEGYASFNTHFLSNFIKTSATLTRNDRVVMRILIDEIKEDLDRISIYCTPVTVRKPSNKNAYSVDITELVRMKHPLIYDLSLGALIALPNSIKQNVCQYIDIRKFSKPWARKAIQRQINKCRATYCHNYCNSETYILCNKTEDQIMKNVNISLFSMELYRYLRQHKKNQ